MIYLDFAATTPMSEKALLAYTEAAKNAFGNASSLHDVGGNAQEWLNACRTTFANIIDGKKEGVIFTSGGTESNLLAIQTLLNSVSFQKRHIISTNLEHSSIRNYLHYLEQNGYEITYLQVDQTGTILVESLLESIREDTAIVIVQHGNSEIGTIQPVEEIGHLLKERNIPFHTDCVQTFGKLDINVQKINASTYSFSSHKIYGPKGVGAVYINPEFHLKPVIPHITHEYGFRPGTVDVPGICSFVTQAKDFYNQREHFYRHFAHLKQLFLNEVKMQKLNITILNDKVENQLPHIIGIITNHVEGQYLMLELNRKGFAVSTGSACQVGKQSPSETLLSIGLNKEQAFQFIRVSFGIHTTEEEILKFVSTLNELMPNTNRKE